MPKIGPAGPRAADVRSDSCMEFVQESVSRCCTEHALCEAQLRTNVPMRLMHLGDINEELSLYEHIASGSGVI